MSEPAMTKPLTLQPEALADYQAWLNTIKQRVVSARLRMALSANRELILFYWELGAMIAHQQAHRQWGDKLIPQLSADLQRAFPDIKGLSTSNLKYCLRFFQFYGQAGEAAAPDSSGLPFGQQAVDQMVQVRRRVRKCLAHWHRTEKSAGNTLSWRPISP